MIKEKVYKVIWNNEEIEVNNAKFKIMQLVSDNFVASIKTNIKEKIDEDFVVTDNYNNLLGFNKYKNNSLLFIFLPLKNSGTKENTKKRFQISIKNKEISQDYSKIFIIGYLKICDKEEKFKYLFFISEDIKNFYTSYINKKTFKETLQQSYSSYWINDWEKIKEVAFSKEKLLISYGLNISNRKNKNANFFVRKYFISKDFDILFETFFEKEFRNATETALVNLIDDDDFLNELKSNKDDFNYEFEQPVKFNFNDAQNFVTICKLKRNKSLANFYLIKNQKCELCNIKKTFKKDNTLIEYFEVHHFIPYNKKVQKYYENTLDHYYNLVSLCPKCHREIHMSNEENRKKLISRIYRVKVNSTFQKYYPETNLDMILKNYKETLKDN
ncbi:HNH endonuclease [Mesoplasma syrphidae]|uniref:HNH endonuclease n=1 Tax=Mesoplasma syrphidae TaxID=225999 RepID=A0A2K9BJV5_9MOLU|nr:HNH endonuclease signature motif containing protein [Mesoplasma syrphidae]AUF83546.1 HNH endonuclease [Mesoplasma syrphidae]